MKKSTVILIAIIYIASIVIISIFGMKAVIFNEIISVREIVCTNETDEFVTVKDQQGKKLIEVPFIGAWDETKSEGTIAIITWQVQPTNASNKKIKLVYDTNTTRAKCLTDEAGNYTGIIVFYDRILFNVRIMSTDGSRVYSDIMIWAK